MKSSRALEIYVILACALGAASAVQTDCFADPSMAACSSFTVNDTAVQAELDQICTSNGPKNAFNGWPASCTLLSECRAGRAQAAFCRPLSLALTACKEQPVLPFCSRYTTLCGPQSVVHQCKTEAALSSVPTADAAFAAATQMCAQMSMSGCQQCSTTTAAGTVHAQAVQVQCPDPLGSLSTICKEMWMPACSAWDTFCKAAANNTAFPALCDYTSVPATSPPAAEVAPTPSPSPEASTPATPAAPPVVANSTAAAQANSSACLQDPTRSECASFVLDDRVVEGDIAALCASMPNMVGCTFWTQCQGGRASGPLCSPFSLFASVCTEMGSMRDCADYNNLCATPGSVVRQCSAQGPVPAAPSTDAATAAVLAMCGDHAMVGCDGCTSRSACPHPLETLSRVCLEMPGMAGCAPFYAMCDEAGSTFPELCGGGGHSDSLPPMKMWLHAGTRDIILIKSWVPESAGAYAASCIAVIALAVVVQALKALRVLSEARWAAERRSSCCGTGCDDKRDSSLPGAALRPDDADSSSGGGGRSAVDVPFWRQLPSREQVGRNAVRSAFTVVVVFLDYMLMLIVMTFNIGLILSAVAGFGAGALLFGHMGESKSGAVAVVGGVVAPDSENDLEVHFVDPQPCCNSQRI